jgi:hypothetical protein
MGLEPFDGQGWPTTDESGEAADDDWNRTQYGLIERDKVILQATKGVGTDAAQEESDARVVASKMKPAAPAGGGSAKSAGGNAVANKNRPANQHGTRGSTKTTQSRDYFSDSLRGMLGTKLPVTEAVSDARREVRSEIERGTSKQEIEGKLRLVFAQAQDKLIDAATRAYRLGVSEVHGKFANIKSKEAQAKIHARVDRYVHRLYTDLSNTLGRHLTFDKDMKNEDAVFASFVFDSLGYRGEVIDTTEVARAYNYGTLSGLVSRGANFISVRRSVGNDCPICDEHAFEGRPINDILLEDIPPLHPRCGCFVAEFKEIK